MEQWHDCQASVTTDTSDRAPGLRHAAVRLDVGKVDRYSILNRLSQRVVGVDRARARRSHGGGALGVGARECDERDLISLDPMSDPPYARSRRTALSTIASKTGWMSVCERLMTPRMSLVAVCVSSALVRSRLLA
jgi:hypothetical protein